MSKITYRLAKENDFSAIIEMIKELAIFENAAEKVINTTEIMAQEQNLFKCFVAENENKEIIGMALYFIAYFTWVGKSLYLDDLFVRPKYRNKGIGTELLNLIFETAKKENCRRLRWQVLNWNIAAIKLYKKLGATVDAGWSNCDFEYEQILKF
ncbi:MAG: GNAT family N-acetyltransferase [Bacteroidales bacterium]|jgi:GNAT superfamily N-acetyltransferase|nr:GNAT family N-acetyltransferase [Bacteroidales bacterium]MCK9498613.1 GNAT family N-acetyltransferase [Bacteroidales bacterium]MDY0313641.1 GNAT family N-acetyltransferase [Bacteroidales bacterium]NLB86233.1 GNAT family N-acetyltransferase [Bacteroidales bacterium]